MFRCPFPDIERCRRPDVATGIWTKDLKHIELRTSSLFFNDRFNRFIFFHQSISSKCKQTLLFTRFHLANVLDRAGRLAAAATTLDAALQQPAAAGASTIGHACRENIAHLRRRRRRPAAEPAAGGRFLVFRFWAGLSNRRQELLGMVGAARLLGRTLVLPPLVEGRWLARHDADRPRAEAAPLPPLPHTWSRSMNSCSSCWWSRV